MSTEPETPETEEEAGSYEPQPAGLSEDDCLIFDRAEFEQDFNCYAVMFKGGQLLSLIHISEPTRPRFGSRMPSSA